MAPKRKQGKPLLPNQDNVQSAEERLVAALKRLSVILTLHRRNVQCPPVAEGQDAAEVQQAFATMLEEFKKWQASVQATAAWKALSAAGKIGEHGLSFVVNGVRITIYTQLLITYLCQADRHKAATLLGLPQPEELVDKLLGILLPRHLDPRPDQEEDQPEGSKAKKKKAKKKAAKKEGPKADAAGQDQGTEEGAAAQDKVEGADGLVTYFYVLELFTVTLPYFCDFATAAAQYHLLCTDLFDEEARTLQDCLSERDLPLNQRRLQAVPPQLVGTSWPALPCTWPDVPTRSMHHSWAEALKDKAELEAVQQTAAAAQRGAGTSGSGRGMAAVAAAGEDAVLVGVVPGQAAAAASRGSGASKGQPLPATADAGVGPVLNPWGAGVSAKSGDEGWDRDIIYLLTLSARQKDAAKIKERAALFLAKMPPPVQTLACSAVLETLYAWKCLAPLDSHPLSDLVTTAASPAADALQRIKASQRDLMEGVADLLLRYECPGALASLQLQGPVSSRLSAAVAAVEAQAKAATDPREQVALMHLADMLGGYCGSYYRLEEALQQLQGVPYPQQASTSDSDSSTAAGGSTSFASSSASSSWDFGTPALQARLRLAQHAASTLAKHIKRPMVDKDSLEECHTLFAGGADNRCGILVCFKYRDRPDSPRLLLKQFHLSTWDLLGNCYSHKDVIKFALSNIIGRPGMTVEEALNEVLVSGYAAGQDSHLFPVEGLMLIVERLQGEPWAELTAEQQAAWRDAHPKLAAPQPLPEGGLVLVSLGMLVPYRGRDMATLREGLVKAPQFMALDLHHKRELLGAVSRLLIREFASVLTSLHKLGILHLDGKPNNVVFQPGVPHTGQPLLDILLDVRYGTATAVDAGTSYTLVPMVGKDGRILLYATRALEGSTFMYAAYYIYHKKGDKKRAAAAPAAVPPEDEAQLDHLPPGSLPAEDCMGADTHMLVMSFAEMATCVEEGEGEDSEVVLELWDVSYMPWNTHEGPGPIPWEDYGFMERVAQAAGRAAVDSTPGCPDMGALIRARLRKESGGTPHEVFNFCSAYYDADIKLLDHYIQRWGGAAAGLST